MIAEIPEVDVTDLKQTGGVLGKELERVLEEKMPPIARKVILIDFDDTIAPFGYMFSFPKPFPGIAKLTQELMKQGYRIGIFTSRLSPTWMESAGQDEHEQREYLKNYCDMYGIHYDFATSEKVPSEAIIDDKAVRFEDNWSDIAKRWGIDVTK